MNQTVIIRILVLILGLPGLVEASAWFVNTRGFMIPGGRKRWTVIVLWFLAVWPLALWGLTRPGPFSPALGFLLAAYFAVQESRRRRFRRVLGHSQVGGADLQVHCGPVPGPSGASLWNDAGDLHLSRVRVTHPRYPASLAPLEFLFVSDLHFGPYAPDWFWERVAEAVNHSRLPLLFGGDLINHLADLEEAGRFLNRLSPGLPKWAVLGNHDHWTDPDAVARALEQAGFKTLRDAGQAWPSLEGVVLYGSDDCAPRRAPLARSGGAFSILLCHVPDRFFEAQASGFDLVVCGHTHGGQIRLPFFGETAVPSRNDRLFKSGTYEREGCRMILGRGIGGPVFYRRGSKPELLYISVVSPGKG